MNQEEKWLLEEKYGGEKCEAFFTDLQRLQAGEPLAYIIGSIPFLNCTIHLDNSPLIPRPETEFWVEKAITEIQRVGGLTSNYKVSDLCAGSGAIGVAVAKALPEAEVHFAELDKNLLPTIAHNINFNLSNNPISKSTRSFLELNPKYRVVLSNLFTPQIQSTRKDLVHSKYNFILSNPPYIDPELGRIEESVSKFEPHLALYGGTEGMELIQKIIIEAPTYLNPNGQLWLEHEPEQSETIKKLGAQNGFSVSTHNDQYDVARYSILVLQ